MTMLMAFSCLASLSLPDFDGLMLQLAITRVSNRSRQLDTARGKWQVACGKVARTV